MKKIFVYRLSGFMSIVSSVFFLAFVVFNTEMKNFTKLPLLQLAIFSSILWLGITLYLLLVLKVSYKKLICKFWAISISIIVFSFIYPSIPSISRHELPAQNALRNNITAVNREAIEDVSTNNYREVKEKYIDNSKDVNYMHFKIQKDKTLLHNISLLDEGSYSDNYMPITQTMVDPFNTSSLLVDPKSNNYITVTNASFLSWEYHDKNAINNSLNVVFSMELLSKQTTCFLFLTEKYDNNNNKMASSESKTVCPIANKKEKIISTFSRKTNYEGDIKYIKFALVPEKLEHAYYDDFYDEENNKRYDVSVSPETTWSISDLHLLMDKTGESKDQGSICLEGFHDGNPEYFLSIYQFQIEERKCSDRKDFIEYEAEQGWVFGDKK